MPEEFPELPRAGRRLRDIARIAGWRVEEREARKTLGVRRLPFGHRIPPPGGFLMTEPVRLLVRSGSSTMVTRKNPAAATVVP